MCVIESSPLIETRRLLLRAPDVADAARVAELCADWDVVKMTTRMPHPYRPEDARAFIDRVNASDPSAGATFLIEHEREGPVGMIGLHQAGEPIPELGYWIGKPFWGRGFASEAAGAVLDWARRRKRRRAVAAGHFPDNPASGRVLEKAGFLYTGEIRRMFCAARGAPADVRMMLWLA